MAESSKIAEKNKKRANSNKDEKISPNSDKPVQKNKTFEYQSFEMFKELLDKNMELNKVSSRNKTQYQTFSNASSTFTKPEYLSQLYTVLPAYNTTEFNRYPENFYEEESKKNLLIKENIKKEYIRKTEDDGSVEILDQKNIDNKFRTLNSNDIRNFSKNISKNEQNINDTKILKSSEDSRSLDSQKINETKPKKNTTQSHKNFNKEAGIKTRAGRRGSLKSLNEEKLLDDSMNKKINKKKVRERLNQKSARKRRFLNRQKKKNSLTPEMNKNSKKKNFDTKSNKKEISSDKNISEANLKKNLSKNNPSTLENKDQDDDKTFEIHDKDEELTKLEKDHTKKKVLNYENKKKLQKTSLVDNFLDEELNLCKREFLSSLDYSDFIKKEIIQEFKNERKLLKIQEEELNNKKKLFEMDKNSQLKKLRNLEEIMNEKNENLHYLRETLGKEKKILENKKKIINRKVHSTFCIEIPPMKKIKKMKKTKKKPKKNQSQLANSKVKNDIGENKKMKRKKNENYKEIFEIIDPKTENGLENENYMLEDSQENDDTQKVNIMELLSTKNAETEKSPILNNKNDHINEVIKIVKKLGF